MSRKKEPRACDVCGRVFTPNTPNQKRCSEACRKEAHRRSQRGHYRRSHQKSRREWQTPKACDICGKTFLPVTYNQKRCSEECARAGRLANHRAYYRRHLEEYLERQRLYGKWVRAGRPGGVFARFRGGEIRCPYGEDCLHCPNESGCLFEDDDDD